MLDLKSNKINRIHAESLGGLKKLKKVFLWNNLISNKDIIQIKLPNQCCLISNEKVC